MKKPSEFATAAEAAKYIMEETLGSAVLVALVFHILEKKGVLKHEDVASAIREAAEFVPAEYRIDPRFRALSTLRTLLDDPALLGALPFRWGPQSGTDK